MSTEKRQYDHRQIRTTGGWLAAGAEYEYREGELTARVRLLRDRSTDDALKFRLEVIASNTRQLPAGSRLTITAEWGGMGEWKLFDAENNMR